MPSFQISLSPHKRTAGRFIALVRRELQKALAEERAARNLTQAAIAEELGVNRSVIHRQIVGYENLTIGRVAELASAMGRDLAFSLHKPAQTGNYFTDISRSNTTSTASVWVDPSSSTNSTFKTPRVPAAAA